MHSGVPKKQAKCSARKPSSDHARASVGSPSKQLREPCVAAERTRPRRRRAGPHRPPPRRRPGGLRTAPASPRTRPASSQIGRDPARGCAPRPEPVAEGGDRHRHERGTGWICRRRATGSPAGPGAGSMVGCCRSGSSRSRWGAVILEGATFTIRARDKVGLVGRNGAGKTSLLKVLGGAGEPRRGRQPHRRPRLPAAGPPARRRRRRITAVRHVLSGAASTRRWPASRSSGSDGGGPVRARHRALHPGRGAVPHRRRLRGRDRGPPLAAGLGLADDRLDLPARRALRRPAPPGRDRPHPLRRHRRAAARRAHQPPRHRRQGLAARLPARLPRRAPRDQPRPRPARRGDHPGPAPRPPRRRQPRHHARVQGHLHPVPANRAKDEVRLAKAARGRPRRSTGCRPSSTASGPRRPRRRWPTAREAHRPPRGSTVEAPQGNRRSTAVPAAAAKPGGSCSRSRTWPSATATSRCSRTSTSRSGAASGCWSWASTAPARRGCCASSPASDRPTAASFRLGHNVSSGTTPRSTRASTPAAVLEHMREQGPGPRHRAAGHPRAWA